MTLLRCPECRALLVQVGEQSVTFRRSGAGRHGPLIIECTGAVAVTCPKCGSRTVFPLGARPESEERPREQQDRETEDRDQPAGRLDAQAA